MNYAQQGYDDATAHFLEQQEFARQQIKDGFALSFCTGYTRERGRYIELQTDQGWNPEPFWQEFSEPSYMGSNDSLD